MPKAIDITSDAPAKRPLKSILKKRRNVFYEEEHQWAGMTGSQLWKSIKGNSKLNSQHLTEAFLDHVISPAVLFEAMTIALQEETAKHEGKEVYSPTGTIDPDDWENERYFPMYCLSIVVTNAMDKLRTRTYMLKDKE